MFVGALSWRRARARAWAYETRSAFISADLSILNMSLLISQYYGRIAVIEMPAIFVLRVFNRQADNRGGVIKRKRGAERGKERILHIQWYAEKHKLLWLFVSVPYSLHVRLYYQIKFDKDLAIYWTIYLIRQLCVCVCGFFWIVPNEWNLLWWLFFSPTRWRFLLLIQRVRRLEPISNETKKDWWISLSVSGIRHDLCEYTIHFVYPLISHTFHISHRFVSHKFSVWAKRKSTANQHTKQTSRTW